MELYNGKDDTVAVSDHNLGYSSSVVVRLLQHLKKNANYKILFDNWFISPSLLSYLSTEGFQALCTVRLSRVPGLFFTANAELWKCGRGSYDVKACITNDLSMQELNGLIIRAC